MNLQEIKLYREIQFQKSQLVINFQTIQKEVKHGLNKML